ncbi:AMIN domain-containing protein, partial [Vibrio cincinnatiensis]
VVDLKNTVLSTTLPLSISDSAILAKIRASSPPENSTFRLVLELKNKSTPQLFKLAPTPGGQYGHRLVIDLPHRQAHSSSISTLPTQSQATISRDASQLIG